MPASWKKAIIEFLKSAGRTLVVLAIIGGAQVLVSLLVWQVMFRDHPQGFAMGLTLVGFASWFLSFLVGLGGRRYAAGMSGVGNPALAGLLSDRKTLHQPGEQLDRSGCGCLVFGASVIPLAIAFIIRVQADLSAGKNWQDIFPPLQ